MKRVLFSLMLLASILLASPAKAEILKVIESVELSGGTMNIKFHAVTDTFGVPFVIDQGQSFYIGTLDAGNSTFPTAEDAIAYYESDYLTYMLGAANAAAAASPYNGLVTYSSVQATYLKSTDPYSSLLLSSTIPDFSAVTSSVTTLGTSVSSLSSSVSSLTTSLAGKADKTVTVNGHALSSNVTVTKSDLSLGNVDNTADASKTFASSQITSGTKTSAFISDFTSAARASSMAYLETTQKTGAFPIMKSAVVASGVAVFNITSDGTSTGSALCPSGVFKPSVQVIVNDANASYQAGWAWSNSDKTLTVTANNFTTASLLSGILGQAAANGKTVNMTVYCN